MVECHTIGPTAASGGPSLIDAASGPSVRLSEVTHLPAGLFQQTDTDCDNHLNSAEFRAVVHEAGLGVEVADKIFGEADTDKDGLLSQRDFEIAYLMMLREHYEAT